jgi:hypothetical protein
MARIYAPTGWRILEDDGAVIANNAFVQADDNDFSLATHGDGFEHLELELVWNHTSAPTANSVLTLFGQDLAINTANNARAPSDTHLHRRLAAVRVDSVTSTQAWRGDILQAPPNFRLWVHGTGITNAVSAGWKARARAFRFGTA